MIRKTALAIVAALAVPAAAFASEGHAEAKAVKTQHSVVLAPAKTPAAGDAKIGDQGPHRRAEDGGQGHHPHHHQEGSQGAHHQEGHHQVALPG